MLHYQPKKSKKSGFSLIELLVVVGIIGILSAIAIPAYNRYRADAARGAFDATGTNIARAFAACISTNQFASCDTLPEINVTCPDCDTPQNSAPDWCVDMESEIGGDTYTGCVSVNASTGAINRTYGTASGTKICYIEASNPPDTTYQAGTDTPKKPLAVCVNASDCGSGTVYCEAGTGGDCKTDGTCE